MTAKIELTMVAAHRNKLLQNMVNLGRKKITDALGIGEYGTNTVPQLTIQKLTNAKQYRNK